MNTQEKSASERMCARGEQTILRLQKKIGLTLFRYTVGERRLNEKGSNDLPTFTYSIYVEYESEGRTSCGFITDFADDKERASGFCRQLARELVTPLSLPFIYEDSLTP